ncbi:MAG: 5'(3')-deoxyribonucleotidase [Firmicutes bacterium]|nr:5'(3')-deoxyribonucleotidase [Bacillota bacterium]
MRILIDMDGVLCNLMDKWLRRYNEDYGDALSTEQITSWGPHRFAKAGRRIYKYLSLPGFFRDLVPLPGAVENMRRLLAAGFDVLIVTAARRGHQDKRDWVSEHLPFFNTDNMIFAHRKELIRGDILFDDAPHHLERFAQYGGEPIAMAYPYNAHVPYRRVASWDDFTEYVLRRADRPARA